MMCTERDEKGGRARRHSYPVSWGADGT
jgi:hypothetical protein